MVQKLFASLTLSRYEPVRSDLWTYDANCEAPGRPDCKSVRLVSRRFAELETPRKALFRDFHLLPTDESIGRLESVASKPSLRCAVSRVTFFPPAFEHAFVNKDAYMDCLADQVDKHFESRLPVSEWTPEERDVMTEALKEKCDPYSDKTRLAGYNAYRNQYAKQHRLLTDPSYPKRVAMSLSRCSGIASAFLTSFDPCGPHYVKESSDQQKSKLGRYDWMTVYHPTVLLDMRHHEFDDGVDDREIRRLERAQKLFRLAMEALAFSNIKLFELATHEIGFEFRFDWSRLVCRSASSPLVRPSEHLLDLSGLKWLHFNPSTFPFGVYGKYGQDWSGCLHPLLCRLSSLQAFSLRFGPMRATNEDIDLGEGEASLPPSFDKLFDLVLPHLRDLHLEGIRFSGAQFATFLRHHPQLEYLTLQDFFVEDFRWKTTFDAIKEHEGITDMELSEFRVVGTEKASLSAVSTLCMDDEDGEYLDLHDYLHEAESSWTLELESRWGNA